MRRMSRRARLAVLWFTTGLASAALLHWRFEFSSAGDTVSYFDIASKYVHGQYADAVVLQWSPGFAWLLMPVVKLPRWEQLPAAHALQVLLVGLAMCAAWRLAENMHRHAPLADEGRTLVLGATLTAGLVAAPARYITPDVAALAIVLWLIARLMSDAMDGGSFARRLATGAVWGAAYLVRTYAAAFGAIAVLLASVIVRRNRPLAAHARWLAPYLVGFVLVGGPWIGVMSMREGRPTWGESGTNNILAALDREPIVAPAWPRMLANGRIHDFERSFRATMPESYDVDPSGTYHYRRPLRNYARILAGNVEALFFGFYPPDMPLFWPLGILGALAWMAFGTDETSRHASARDGARWLLACGAVGLAMFVLVHVESRYVAPFIVLIAAAIAWRWPTPHAVAPARRRSLLTAVALLFWLFPLFVWADSLRSSRAPRADALASDAAWLASQGQRFAVVGATYDLGTAAWLSDSTLIASVDLSEATPADCASIARVLETLHVDAVFASRPAGNCGPWRSSPSSGWWAWVVRGSQ